MQSSFRIIIRGLIGSVLPALAAGQSNLIYDGEARWVRDVRQLTRPAMGLERAGEAYFSADGRQVCFQAYPTGKKEYQIYVINSDGTGLKMVSTGQAATTCAFFHSDGKRLIFAANHHDPREPVSPEFPVPPESRYRWDVYPGMDLFECALPTGELKRLTTADGYDAEGSYSPDGKLIVFTSMRDGDREIYIMNADGSNPRRITNVKGYDGGPFFSPDGKRIVYRSDRVGDGNMQIFVNDLQGAAEKAITGRDVLNWCPYWHPSGKWLIFTRADHGTPKEPRHPNYDLYLLRDDGSETLRVTTFARPDVLPAFSTDGRKLMWTSRRGPDDTPQIFVAEFVGLTPDGKLAEATGPVSGRTGR